MANHVLVFMCGLKGKINEPTEYVFSSRGGARTRNQKPTHRKYRDINKNFAKADSNDL